ncbi:MAG: 5'-methylthioadenosine/S-adenosylhomocysteine nucleosidase [Thermodesulfobacteriota bacterium]|nr:MAG: 5'-methylthioadenosine/S-adenosylhomocysteine nucleosidase [Thermodesulfobacteriota bacterium]
MIALLTATWDEIRLLKREIQISEQGTSGDLEYLLGNLYGQSVIVAELGVGIRRARVGTSFVIQKFKPSLIIVGGFGGALSSDLNVGDIVLGESVTSLKKNESLELSCDISVSDLDFKKGPILSESRFINEPDQKKNLFEASNALVVDMETWGVSEAAQQSKTPVISIRAVSDEHNERLPDMAALYGNNGQFDFAKADNYFKAAPDLLSPYLKFRFTNSPMASDSLTKFLSALIPNLL